MSDQPDYCLVLRPLRHDAPPVVRLRRVLKALLRTYAFRCVSVGEVPAGPQTAMDKPLTTEGGNP